MKAYHVVVGGPSGEGKTTYLRQMHATADAASLFLTTKAHESGIAGDSVGGREGLNGAVRRATRGPDVRAKWLGARYPEAAQIAREWAHDVREYRGWSVQIVADETQNDPGMTSSSADTPEERGPIRLGLHEDRDLGTKWVVCTQEVQELSYEAIRQTAYFVWVGRPKSWHRDWLNHHGFLDLDLPSEQYEYVVIEPTLPPKIVYRGTTDERYA